MVYCLCSAKDDHIIRTFHDFVHALVFLMVYNDHFIDGSYLKYLMYDR